MKKTLALGIILVFALIIPTAAEEFGYPAAGEAWYFIKAGFTNTAAIDKGLWTIKNVSVDGTRARDFAVFQSGKEMMSPEINGEAAFDLKIRWSWEKSQAYEIKIDLENTPTGRTAVLTQKAKAPAKKGYWNPSWKNYLSLILSEDNGYERVNYPVHATVGILSNYLKSPDEIRIVAAQKKGEDIVYTEIPHQVYDVRTWNDPKITALVDKDEKTGKPISRYHPTTSLSLAFLANLRPHEKATYLVFYNNPGAKRAALKSSLKVAGQGLGKTIENDFYKVILHPKSGTIYEVTEKSSNIKLEHKLETNGAIHWNPDVYAPPHAWYHSSDWSNPEATEVAGPVFYSLNLKGSLPLPKGIDIGLRYHFYAGSPVVMVESVTDIRDDLFVMALRNAEVVFNAAVFTKAAFKRDGKTEILDFAASPMHPAHAAVLRPDTPWVSLFDEAKGIGFAALYLDLATPNLNGGQASLQQPYIYIQHGLWFYVSRGFVYSFGSNNQTRMLPVKAGSVYYDRNAWIAFPYPRKEGLGDYLDRQFNALKYPLAVREDIETFAESPEGWVVPILTEPFEEGVKDAKGGKDRRK